MRALFTATVFLSAFFLFAIEPIAGKILLPMFGGSASVWTAAMVFFQLALLVGYAYANWAAKRPLAHVAVIQGLAVVLSAVAMTWTDAAAQRLLAAGNEPSALHVAWALTLLVGPVFVVLSATAPLLQRVFAFTRDPIRHSPYFLYAASNAGSLLALLAYPAVIEPFLGVHEQFADWSVLARVVLGAGLVCVVATIAVARRHGAPSLAKADESTQATSPEPPTTARQRLKWLTLAAAPSSLLLGVTTFLTTSVAPIPLLWVVPLALYLITFIVAFAHRRPLTAAGVGRWLPGAATPLALALILESSTPIVPLAILHLGVAFMAMLACHLRLSESRPGPARLTEFYLWLALGGALGGLFNAVVAPVAFTTLFEYPLALAACCALAVLAKPSGGLAWERADWRWPAAVAGLTALAMTAVHLANLAPSTGRTLLTIGAPALLCFLGSGRTVRFGLSLIALFAIASIDHVSAGGRVLFSARSFYGVHRVVQDDRLHLRKLVHGNTVHGMQSTLGRRRSEPLTYYGRMGPAGLVFRAIQRQGGRPNVGLIGLGVGSMAAYGEPGQSMTFFEIDPVVIHVATDPSLFSFLSDSKATVRVVQGDGRLTLAKQPDGSFGVLVLDAFTSDAIPVHLLTEEAIRMYVRKLTPHGVILFHVSNNYLDLAPVLAAEARDLNLAIRLNDDSITSDSILATGIEPSKWVIIARSSDDFMAATRFGGWERVPPAKRGWTDDYSNILSAFRLSGDESDSMN